VIVCVCVE